MAKPTVIVFPLYPGVTHLDFTGPHQFFSRLPDTQVVAASIGAVPITADGLTFDRLANLESIEGCDVLCVPGGQGCTEAMQDAPYMAAIRRLAPTTRYLTSVCTGSLILAAAGLLEGRRAACHWAWRELLVPFGAIPDPARVVRDGNIITGGGVTAGIDFALSVIAEIAGPMTAQSIQLGLEYAPVPPFHSGSPEEAPAVVLKVVTARMKLQMAERRTLVERLAAAMKAGH